MTQERETPKNRKQIGMADKRNKIYIEDYVVSYLNRIATDKDKKGGIAGLFGCCRETGEGREFYIYAATFEEAGEDGEAFRRESIQKIMRKRAESFADYFFLGWCFIVHAQEGAVWEKFYRSRLESLLGLPELLLTLEKGSCEEHFYTYPTDMPKETEGYFIFYEQNERMQNFMVDAHWNEEVVRVCEPDDVAKSCREYYKEKKAEKKRNRMAIACCGFFLLLMAFAFGSRISGAIGADDETKEVALVNEEAWSDKEGELPGVEDFQTGQAGDDLGELPVWESDSFIIEEEVSLIPESEAQTDASEDSFIADLQTEEAVIPAEELADLEKVQAEDSAKAEKEDAQQEEMSDEESCATYVVSKGDTLYGICMSFYGDLSLLEEICSINEIDDMNNILCGQKILLPRQNM